MYVMLFYIFYLSLSFPSPVRCKCTFLDPNKLSSVQVSHALSAIMVTHRIREIRLFPPVIFTGAVFCELYIFFYVSCNLINSTNYNTTLLLM